jgi:hypothetical protein
LILLLSSVGICKNLEGTIFDKNHKETGHWRYDRGTKEIVIYNDLYEETGRIKKNNYGGFNVYDEYFDKVGEIEGEKDW